MDKKDLKIQKMLEGYAESNKPDLRITVPAKIRLSEKRRAEKKFDYFRFFAKAAAAACAVALIAVGIGTLSKNRDISHDSADIAELNTYYSPADVIVYDGGTEDEGNIKNLAPWLDTANSEIYKFCGKQDNETVLYYIKSRYDTGNGFAEIKLFIEADKTSYYTSLNNFRYIGKYAYYNGIKISSVTEYIDGEYMSSVYFEENGIRFYIDYMSNSGSALEDYLNYISKT
jgi:hypothetical protein